MLQTLVGRGNLQRLKHVLSNNETAISAPDPENGWPLFYYAIKFHQTAVLEYLLEVGSEGEQISQDFCGNTAAIVAIEYGNIEALQIYLKSFSNCINMENHLGQTPCLLAAELGNTEILELLIKNGCDLTHSDNQGNNVVHHAASNGHFECVYVLALNNAPFDAVNDKGWKPSDYAYSVEIRDYTNECESSIKMQTAIKKPNQRKPSLPSQLIPMKTLHRLDLRTLL